VTPAERFWAKVDFDKLPGSCWGWTAAKNQYGYGTIAWNGKKQHAMRAAYELLVGPIPDGMELDHLCHTFDWSCDGGLGCLHRECVNPDHLEPVTKRENALRMRRNNASARKTHCKRGHPFSEENTVISGGTRYCLTCRRRRDRERYQRDPEKRRESVYASRRKRLNAD
jgi:hypothetical protein